jgi:hypothetical protein
MDSNQKAPTAGLYAMFATDTSLEKTGIELQYGSIVIRIARAGGGNAKFNRVLEAKVKPVRRMIQTETLPPDQLEALMREVYADSVILGWSGVTDAEGKTLEFTKPNVIKVLSELPDLFEDIKAQANKAALFRKEELDAAVKN